MKLKPIYLLNLVISSLASIGGAVSCQTADLAELGELAPSGGIINGKLTDYEKWQGVVGVFSNTQYTVCTGTLVHPQVVLTGGHCVVKKTGSIRFDYVKNPKPLRIYGGPDIQVWNGVTPIAYPRADRVVSHPEWDDKTHSADLALIKLEKPITADGVAPYPLRSEPPPAVGDDGVHVGYGRFKPEDNTSDGLHREGFVKIEEIKVRAKEGPYRLIRTGGSNQTTCSGDSGGPLFTEQNGQWVISGVASMGSCYTGTFDDNINVDLVEHESWIRDTVCELVGETPEGQSCKGAESESGTDSDESAATDEETEDDEAEIIDGGEGEEENNGRNSGCQNIPLPAASQFSLFELAKTLLSQHHSTFVGFLNL